MKGLVIDEPWISLILDGMKTWEMRTGQTHVRGRVALIRKGSGLVVGLADLVDCIGPLDAIARRAHRDRHRIPADLDQSTERWNTAWVLENAIRLVAPVAYTHPSGAVIWVKLDESVSARLVGNFGAVSDPAPLNQIPTSRSSIAPMKQGRAAEEASLGIDPGTFVPVAKDGSYFLPSLKRAKKYTVGKKGEEQTYESFADALAELQTMSTPYWRRPNSNGNWGIVAGVRWAVPHQESLDMERM